MNKLGIVHLSPPSLPRQLLKVGQARRGLWHVQWIRLGFWLRPVEDLQERGRLGAHPRVDVGLQMRRLVSDELAGSESDSPIPIFPINNSRQITHEDDQTWLI